jgi:hypothetical protein
MPFSPRRARPDALEAGPSSRAPRAGTPVRPASNRADSPPSDRPDLNAHWPGSPRHTPFDRNDSLAGFPRPAWVDLNASPPTSPRPRRFDLNDAAAGSARPASPDPRAPAARSASPDSPLPAAAASAMAQFGIQGMPQPADLVRVLELVRHQPNPEFEDRVLHACEEMLVLMGSSEELLEALDERYASHPVMSRVINQLMDHIVAIEDISDGSHSQGVEAADGLQADVEQQNAALGVEIRAWDPSLETSQFDEESNARPFARMLSRLLERRDEGSSSSAAEQLTLQVSSVIRAIAADAGLRAQVFVIAESALGSCTDNLAEGFSNVVLAVSNHQMAQAVERGSVGAVALHRWAGQQLRLSLLESAVNRFIADSLQRPELPRAQRESLRNEPLETMVHAKVALRENLGLPEGTVSTMRFRTCSVLTQANLDALATEVARSSSDPATRDAFLLGNATWRAGMTAAHPQAFADLARERDEDPFHDLDLPSTLEEQIEYAGLAREVEAKWARREDELLLALAAGRDRPSAPQ